jgi:hypothetical protein
MRMLTLMLGATVALGGVGTAFAEDQVTSGLTAADAVKIFKSCISDGQCHEIATQRNAGDQNVVRGARQRRSDDSHQSHRYRRIAGSKSHD